MTELLRKWGIGALYVFLLAQQAAVSDVDFVTGLSDRGRLIFKVVGFVCLGLRIYLDMTPGRKNDTQFGKGENPNVIMPDFEVTGMQGHAVPSDETKENNSTAG